MAGTKKHDKAYSENWGGKRSNSGGKREGAGRPKLSESGRKQIQFSLQQNEIDLIKALAEQSGLNKSRFIMECVNFYNENHK